MTAAPPIVQLIAHGTRARGAVPPPNYRQVAAQDARKYGVPEGVFLRQIQQESGFNPAAHSSAGADGIAQFIPSTARSYGVNTRDPRSSLDGAARMDADLIKRYGSVARALSAYNSGRPDAYQDPGFAGGQTYNYVRTILHGQTPTVPPLTAAAPLSTTPPARLTSSEALPALRGAPATVPPPQVANRSALLFQLAQQDQPNLPKLLSLLAQRAPVAAAPVPRALPPPQPVAAPPAPQMPQMMPQAGNGSLAELIHEYVGGPTHSTGEHIHFASTNPQTELAGINLAEKLGLHVGENPYVGSVAPGVHAPHSYHYRTFPGLYNGRRLGEAVDASGTEAAMTRLYQLLQQRYGR